MSAYEVDWDAATENRYAEHRERLAALMEEWAEDRREEWLALTDDPADNQAVPAEVKDGK